jgi:hypothetical protein
MLYVQGQEFVCTGLDNHIKMGNKQCMDDNKQKYSERVHACLTTDLS